MVNGSNRALQIAKEFMHMKQSAKTLRNRFFKEIDYPSKKTVEWRRIMYATNKVDETVMMCQYNRSNPKYNDFPNERERKLLKSCSSLRQFQYNPFRFIGICNDDYTYLDISVKHALQDVCVTEIQQDSYSCLYLSDDIFDYIEYNFRKNCCAKKIQRAVRVWLGKPEYRSGRKGLIYRKALDSWNRHLLHTP